MSFGCLGRLWFALLPALLLAGCLPAGHSQLDEEKEPHFLSGKSRVSAMDYSGAVESFSKAVEVNPRSGAAHLELGWLYDQKQSDPAAAIYHYSKYLNLRANAPNADTIKNRIMACKQELARTVSLGPVTQSMQKELEQLMLRNKAMEEEIAKLKSYVTNLEAMTNRLTAQLVRTADPGMSQRQNITSGPAVSNESRNTSQTRTPVSPSGRTHTVRSGETPTQIARKYNVSLSALQAANPRMNPTRMKPGDVLRIP